MNAKKIIDNITTFTTMIIVILPMILFTMWWATKFPGFSDVMQVLSWLLMLIIGDTFVEILYVTLLVGLMGY